MHPPTAHRPPPRLPARLAGALLLALAALAPLAACGGGGGPAPAPPPPEGASAETIVAADGVRLSARLFAADPDRIAILLHMFRSDQAAWREFARTLQTERGTSALTLDFRGHGASGGERDPGGIDRDVRAALAFARERGYRRAVLVGASMGATAAIVAAADANGGGAEGVDGVVSISAPARMRGLDAADAVARVGAPLTLVAARGDLSARNALEGLAGRAGLGADALLVTPGAAHGTGLLASPDGDAVRAHVLAFLDAVWGGR